MMHSVVAKIKRMAGTFRQEREGILNWWKKGSTDSFLERLNSPTQSAKSTASGFRSIAYFKTMILLRLGNSNSRPRGSWPVLPTRNIEEPKEGAQPSSPRVGVRSWDR
ncbi:MAG: transposase [Coriobacteriaceae bacterium]